MTDRRAHDPFAPADVEPTPAARATHDDDGLPTGLDQMKKAELQKLAQERHLDTDGTRPELIERLRAHG